MRDADTSLAVVDIGYARVVLDYLVSHGGDIHAVLGDAAPGLNWPDSQALRLTVEQWQGVLDRVVDHFEDPALPLRLAAEIRLRHLGLLGFLLMSSATLGAAARVLQDYECLLGTVNETVCLIGDDGWHLEWHPLVANPSNRLIWLSLAAWVHLGRWLCERPDLRVQAAFRGPEPTDAATRQLFDDTFGADVRFNQPVDRISLPMDYWALPVVQANAEVHEVLRVQADAHLQALGAARINWLGHIETVVQRQLATGGLALGEVARALELSPRTLQHRLDAHGLTYRELVDRVRCREAERHLCNPLLSLTDVAMRLGFADQSSFQHAFKRWKGASPGEFRRRVLMQ
jgi:AraC-like DNA-binding protein